jgi:hypothetical protein
MRQQPGGHVAMTHGAFPETAVGLVNFAGRGVRRVENRTSVAVEQHVILGGLIRLWMLSCCGGGHD